MGGIEFLETVDLSGNDYLATIFTGGSPLIRQPDLEEY